MNECLGYKALVTVDKNAVCDPFIKIGVCIPWKQG
jgi:hypothetical protein